MMSTTISKWATKNKPKKNQATEIVYRNPRGIAYDSAGIMPADNMRDINMGMRCDGFVRGVTEITTIELLKRMARTQHKKISKMGFSTKTYPYELTQINWNIKPPQKPWDFMYLDTCNTYSESMHVAIMRMRPHFASYCEFNITLSARRGYHSWWYNTQEEYKKQGMKNPYDSLLDFTIKHLSIALGPEFRYVEHLEYHDSSIMHLIRFIKD